MKRRYTDQEIGALIRRATELQEGARATSEHRLSLDEIEHIAVEMGIDPRHLRTAALELDSRTSVERRFSLIGRPFRIERSLLLPGTVREDQWERLVIELRRRTGSVGTTSALGQTREWTQSLDALEHTHVALRSHGDQTALEVRKHYAGAARVAYTVTTIAFLGLAGILMDGTGVSDILLLAVTILTALAALGAARAGLGIWTGRQTENIEALLEELHETLAGPDSTTHSTAPTGEVVERQEAQRIDLPERDGADGGPGAEAARVRVPS